MNRVSTRLFDLLFIYRKTGQSFGARIVDVDTADTALTTGVEIIKPNRGKCRDVNRQLGDGSCITGITKIGIKTVDGVIREESIDAW